MPTVYLPVHVDRSSIHPCIVDKRWPFVDIESERQAIEQQETEYQAAEQRAAGLLKSRRIPFIVLEKDYFTIYHIPGSPLKCGYISRNYLTMMAYYYRCDPDVWSRLEVRNGLTFNPEPTIIYFISEKCTDIMFEHPAECNSVLVYYREKDVEKFAETTRAADGCCNHIFFVYEDGVQQCFDANNTDNNYTLAETLTSMFLPAVRKDVGAIKQFKEKDRLFGERQMFQRLPNGEFTLKDANGDVVHDGEEFSLVVIRNDDDEDGDGHFEFDAYFLNLSDGEFMAIRSHNKPFACDTIDGILYLKRDEEYLYCSRNSHNTIRASPELPERPDRLQIIYDGAHILLTRWGESTFATCEWEGRNYGSVMVNGNWYDYRFNVALRLRLVNTQRNYEV